MRKLTFLTLLLAVLALATGGQAGVAPLDFIYITGDLTIRGVTQPVTLDVRLNKIGPYPWGSNYVVGVSAETTIRRSDFGSTYALEGGLVGDEIPLTFEIEAIRQD